MKPSNQILTICTLPLLSSLCSTALSQEPKTKPNVIILFLDDVSARDFGCYGIRDPKTTNTPNIDKLASQSLLFDYCWGTPLSGPSRAMMMTGRYATQTDWWDNNMKPKGKNESNSNFAENNLVANKIFKNNGYSTAFFGKWQLGSEVSDPSYGVDLGLISGEKLKWKVNPYPCRIWPESSPMPGAYSWEFAPSMHIWDAETGKNEYIPTNVTDYAADIEFDYIKQFIRKNKDKKCPFFVYWPTHVGHEGWEFDTPFKRGWSHTATPLRDKNGNQLYNADGSKKLSAKTYKAHIEYADYMMGAIQKFLKEEKLDKNTIVVFAADNGARYYGKGCVSQQRGTHVPLIISVPGITDKGKHSKAMVSLADVTPTLVDLAHLKLPEKYTFDGLSLKPLLTGEKDKVRTASLSYLNVCRMVRNDRFVLDGWDRLWDTNNSNDCKDYIDVTDKPENKMIYQELKDFRDTRLPMPSAYKKYYQDFLKSDLLTRNRKLDSIYLKDEWPDKYDLPRTEKKGNKLNSNVE